MGCCDSDSVQVSKMALEMKSGPMLWHKKRFFGSNWRDVHSVLYNDSSLFWYKDLSRQEQDGGVVLKEAPELIAYGIYTSQVPDRPPLPDNYEPKQMLAFGVRGKDVVYWFLCPNQEEVASWMAAIASTMPPPPGAPQAPLPENNDAYHNNQSQQQQMPHPQMPQQPMSQHVSQQPMSAPPYAPQQPPPQYTPNQQQVPSYAPRQQPGIPGQYPPPTSYRPPPYQGYNTVHPQPYPAANGGGTTVVVQQDRPGYIGGGGGDFAMGMLLGGAIGTAWGSRPSFGVGFGYGGGWGHGGGWSNHNSTTVNDNDVTINNYYDNDTSVVNNNIDTTNNLDMSNNMSLEQTQIPQALPPPMQENIVEDYVPIEDTGNQGYDNGCDDYGGGGFADDYGGGGFADDYGGGDFGGDFGGGDFGDF